MGALDVCPFVPVMNISMEECVTCAHIFGQRLAAELGVPGEWVPGTSAHPIPPHMLPAVEKLHSFCKSLTKWGLLPNGQNQTLLDNMLPAPAQQWPPLAVLQFICMERRRGRRAGKPCLPSVLGSTRHSLRR